MTDPLGLIRSQLPYTAMQPGRMLAPLSGGPAAGSAGAGETDPAGGPAATGPSFKDVLLKQIGEVNNLQREAEDAVNDMMSGKPVSASTVMSAQAKADTAFLALMQVRNKVLDMYTEIKEIRV